MEIQHISQFLPLVLKPEQAVQELTRQKVGDEVKFELAIASPVISKCSVDEIKQVLRLVMVKVGLRSQNWPEGEEKAVLIEHIVSNFGGHRIEEVKLAFDMAIAGKLDVEVNCYENFSCYYFSTIMNAYRKWAALAYRQLEPKIDEKPPQKIFTPEEIDDSAREDVERQYQLFLKRNELRGVEICKAILEKDGLIKEGENVLDFFKRWVLSGHPNVYVKANV